MTFDAGIIIGLLIGIPAGFLLDAVLRRLVIWHARLVRHGGR